MIELFAPTIVLITLFWANCKEFLKPDGDFEPHIIITYRRCRINLSNLMPKSCSLAKIP